ncbi:hypothetical protein HAV21_12620 [Paenarthrobacter sp. MSM-2-10-13]|uniref:hypothetical protein n=1 Tax=Paenarthrobacter sp. MSM-2-10-13 TaxID=2717318 RepID=UPI001422A0C7|nr:hypothetical protein [Paenarthrobacter sp. MSM-2-10-13]NHW47728.1 hypothetical protein [Paenarthrobacter sp. MSM-2-10-13]
MTALIVWLGFGLVFSVVFVRRMHIVLVAVIVARILVPGVVQNEVMPGLHPSTYLFLCFILVQLAFTPSVFGRVIRSAGVLPQATIGGMAAVMMTDVGNPGSAGLLDTAMFVLGIVVAPYYVFVFMRYSIRSLSRAGKAFLLTFALLALAEAVLSQAQVATGRPVVWESDFSRIWLSGTTSELGAAIGTFGHGIQVGVLFAATMPLLALIKSMLLRFALAAVLLVTVPLAYGRMGLILTVAGFVFLVIIGGRKVIRSILFAAVVLIALLVSVQGVAGEKLLRKFEDDNGSAALRVAAFDWFWEHTADFFAGGYPGARDLKGVGTLGSSLENGYFIMALMFGTLAAVAFFIFMICLLFAQIDIKDRGSWPGAAAAALIIVAINGYSSIGGNSIDIHLFWFVLAMASYRSTRTLPAVDGIHRASSHELRPTGGSSGFPVTRVPA